MRIDHGYANSGVQKNNNRGQYNRGNNNQNRSNRGRGNRGQNQNTVRQQVAHQPDMNQIEQLIDDRFKVLMDQMEAVIHGNRPGKSSVSCYSCPNSNYVSLLSSGGCKCTN